MVAGSIRPLIDALRIAYVELIEWLVADYGFEKMEAYQVVSQAGVVAGRQHGGSELHGGRQVPEATCHQAMSDRRDSEFRLRRIEVAVRGLD